MKSDKVLYESIKVLDNLESKDVREYIKSLGTLNRNLPPVAKDKHSIWVSIFPNAQYFLDVIGEGKNVEKIIYFVKSGSKTELTFNKKGELKKKEVVAMQNYPRNYKAIKEEWVKTFKETNKERIIPFGEGLVAPISRVDTYLESNRSLGKAVMLNPDNKLEDNYNTIRSMYKYFWNMEVREYIISYKGKEYTLEGADFVEIYALQSDKIN